MKAWLRLRSSSQRGKVVGSCDCWFMGHTYMQLDDCHIARDDGQRVRSEAVEHDAARLQAALTQN